MARPQSTTKTLLCALTPEELNERSERLAKATKDADAQEAAIDEAKGLWSAKKKSMEGYLHHLREEASELAEVVDSGKEEREVPCSWLYSLANEAAFLIRDDTGELVTSRRLEEETGQQSLIEEVLREPTPEQLAAWLPELPARRPEAAGG